MQFYITTETKKEIEETIEKLENERQSLTCSPMDDEYLEQTKKQSHIYGKIQTYREIVSSSFLIIHPLYV